MTATASGPVCKGCGAPRSAEDATRPAAGRARCQSCGDTSLLYSIHLTETIAAVADLASATLTPGDAANDWAKRWRLIQKEVVAVAAPRASSLSAEAIHEAEREVLQAIVSCYHLKDILIQDRVVPGRVVETVITKDPALALLADLANLDKHHKLTKPPRSGHIPIHRPASGTTSSGAAGWRVNVTFDHDGKVVDATDLLIAAVDSWRRFLRAQGLE